MMEFYDKYGKIKRISVIIEPIEKKETKYEVKPEPKPEAKPVEAVAEPEIESAAEATVEPEIEPVEEAAVDPEIEPVEEAAVEPEIEPVEEATAEPEVEPAEEATLEPEVEPIVEVTSKHWTIPVPAVETPAEPVFEPVPEKFVQVSPEPAAEPIVEVTAKHWTIPVPVVEMDAEQEAATHITKEEEDIMVFNKFDKTEKKEINYCEDICKDEEQKKVCFYYRNKEYLTDDFINKCDEALDFEMNQKKEQEERAERERLLKELFGNEEE